MTFSNNVIILSLLFLASVSIFLFFSHTTSKLESMGMLFSFGNTLIIEVDYFLSSKHTWNSPSTNLLSSQTSVRLANTRWRFIKRLATQYMKFWRFSLYMLISKPICNIEQYEYWWRNPQSPSINVVANSLSPGIWRWINRCNLKKRINIMHYILDPY